jgi:hypothetical protein
MLTRLPEPRKVHPFLKNMSPQSLQVEDDVWLCQSAILKTHFCVLFSQETVAMVKKGEIQKFDTIL